MKPLTICTVMYGTSEMNRKMTFNIMYGASDMKEKMKRIGRYKGGQKNTELWKNKKHKNEPCNMRTWNTRTEKKRKKLTFTVKGHRKNIFVEKGNWTETCHVDQGELIKAEYGHSETQKRLLSMPGVRCKVWGGGAGKLKKNVLKIGDENKDWN